ncbi:nuclear transport factor 2 family protein [Actinoplanes sp. CA-054009]
MTLIKRAGALLAALPPLRHRNRGEKMDHLTAPVQRALDAANANDIDAFLASFTDDGVVDDWGREFRGAERIRGWSDNEFIGKRVALTVKDIHVRGDDTTVTVEVGGDGYTGPGHFTFRVSGDRVARMTIRA